MKGVKPAPPPIPVSAMLADGSVPVRGASQLTALLEERMTALLS